MAQYTELVAGRMSSSARWAGWILLAALIGLAAAILLEDRAPLEQRVLARAPAGASIVAYAEIAPLRTSDLLGRIVRERLLALAGLSLVEPDIDAVAVALGSDRIVGLAAGRFPLSLVQRYLEKNGGTCEGDVDEQACSLPTPRGFLSIRGLDSGLLGVVNGPRANGADSLASAGPGDPHLAMRARAALDGGALVWVSIDPKRLAETMSDPPKGWINLSLVARALLSANQASLELEDDEVKNGVRLMLTAGCGSVRDAEELSKMLESLNGLLVSALRMGTSRRNRAWAAALETDFSAASDDRDVVAEWLLPAGLLEESIELELGR